MASTLPNAALNASRAALNAAMADQDAQAKTDTAVQDDSNESGEVQEIDMQAQAEGIRTVFSDPTNFNVKVCMTLGTKLDETAHGPLISIPCIHHGLCGSIRLLPRAVIFPRHRYPHSLQLQSSQARLVQLQRKDGWRI